MKRAPRGMHTETRGERLLGQALARENMAAAWKRVKANKGSAGVDGWTIEQTAEYLETQWPRHARATAARARTGPAGTPGGDPEAGGRRARAGHTDGDGPADPAGATASAATADRPDFSEHSYGFRPGRTGARRGARRRSGTCRRDGGWWWTWIWRSSSTASITTS